jgi:4-hydroxybenzoate polyprenyltransferase
VLESHALLTWTDSITQIQDKTDDIHANVRSTALLFGEQSKPILSAFSLSFCSLLAYAGHLNAQGLPFYMISVAGAASHLLWQIRKLKIDDRANCWELFKSNRNLGFIVWSGIMADYLGKVLLV